MLYVCEKRGDLYGIADTDSCICEFFSKDDVFVLARDISILGVSLSTDSIVIVSMKTVLAKEKMLRGTVEGIKFNFYLNYLDDYELISVSNISCFDVYNCKSKTRIHIPRHDMSAISMISEDNNIRIKNLIRKKNNYFTSIDNLEEAKEIFVYGDNIITNIYKFLNIMHDKIKGILNTVVGRIEYVYYCQDKDYLYIYYSYSGDLLLFGYSLYFDVLILMNRKSEKPEQVPENHVLLYDFYANVE